MNDKFCEACGDELIRRTQETRSQWDRRKFCSQACVGRFRTMMKPAAYDPFACLRGQGLTARERQIVQLVARGLTSPQIAVELKLAPNTIKTHLQRIGVKLGTTDRAGIVGVAIRGGHLQVPVMRQVPDGFDRGLFDVLVRIARGMSNAEIGGELYLSLEAVKARVRRLLMVLGVRSREAAVAAGVACGALRLVPVRRPERVAA